VTDAELDRLADLIARALIDAQSRETASRPVSKSWLPIPVRPEPPARGSEPPVWSGAAQELGDVAPSEKEIASKFRATTGELTRATRAAAAGKGAPVERGKREPERRIPRARASNAPAIDVKIGVSNRHVHLSVADQQTLFGGAALTVARELTQPGQFAATQTVVVQGPKGKLDSVRIVGPARGDTQLEIAVSDASVLGVDPPVAASGKLQSSIGGVTLIGPAGRVELRRGVITAARHLHLSPSDSRRWGLRDGDLLTVKCGSGPRAITFHDVLVRCGDGHATELHVDSDEARAAGVKSGDSANVIAWQTPGSKKRRLVTERDVLMLAKAGERIPSDALLTPSARDRASALGLLDR
jgi:putative phosphotransacetylase